MQPFYSRDMIVSKFEAMFCKMVCIFVLFLKMCNKTDHCVSHNFVALFTAIRTENKRDS